MPCASKKQIGFYLIFLLFIVFHIASGIFFFLHGHAVSIFKALCEEKTALWHGASDFRAQLLQIERDLSSQGDKTVNENTQKLINNLALSFQSFLTMLSAQDDLGPMLSGYTKAALTLFYADKSGNSSVLTAFHEAAKQLNSAVQRYLLNTANILNIRLIESNHRLNTLSVFFTLSFILSLCSAFFLFLTGKRIASHTAPVLKAAHPEGKEPETEKLQELIEAAYQKYQLSKRERDVLRLIIAGRNAGDIAQILEISPNTVSRHLANIYRKTGVNNKYELFALLFTGNLKKSRR